MSSLLVGCNVSFLDNRMKPEQQPDTDRRTVTDQLCEPIHSGHTQLTLLIAALPYISIS